MKPFNSQFKWHYFLFLMFLLAQCTKQASQNSTNTTVSNDEILNETTAVPNWLQQSTKELETFMSDKYNYFLTPGGNKVWVCSMNLAWNQMKRQILQNQNALFQNTTQLQNKIVSNLNSELFTRKQLSDSAYYVSAGYGQKQLDKINLEVKQKFPQTPFVPLNYKLKDQDFISYAYLQKILQFNIPFSTDSTFKFKNISVEAFSATNSKQQNQLYTKYYNNSNEFMMGIETTNPNEEVLILKTNRSQMNNFRMEKVLQIVQLYSNLPKNKLKRYDIFKMPVLSFDYKRRYEQMIGAKFMNKGFEDYQLSMMYQNLILNLDRTGIKASSQAVIVGTRITMPFDLKMLVMDRDFWLILKQKNRKPYLVIHIQSLKETWTV